MIPLVNDKEGLYLKAARLKSLAAIQQIANHEDVLTVCNGLLQLLDELPILEKAVKCMQIVREFHNFVHNI